MKPNPLAALDIPKDWPKEGIKPDGSKINLREAWATMTYAGLGMLQVDVPDLGRIAPWGNLVGLDDFALAEGVEGLMPREDLESNGFTDSTLEGWARDKHGITLDLSGADSTDLQAIRWDAYRRFLSETEW